MSNRKPHSLKMTVGANIARMRQAKGWSQGDLASKLGIGRDSLSRIESGISGPRFTNLEKLSELLDCSPADFFVYSGDVDVVRPPISPEEEILMLSQRISALTRQLIEQPKTN